MHRSAGARSLRRMAAHQALVEVQVVEGVEPRAQDLAAAVQVVQVGARVVPAGGAGASGVDRPLVVAVAPVADLDDAPGHEEVAEAVLRAEARVEEVDTAPDRAGGPSVGTPIATGPVVGEQRPRGVQQPRPIVERLADREAVHLAVDTRSRPCRAALDQGARPYLPARCRTAADCWCARSRGASAQRARRDSRGGPASSRGTRCSYVERHHHVGPSERHAVERGARKTMDAGDGERFHPRLGNGAPRTEAEHLESARVREDRSLPVHEPVQAAERLHRLRPRAQHQVEGVGDGDPCRGSSSSSGASFTVAVPTEHERRRLDDTGRGLMQRARKASIGCFPEKRNRRPRHAADPARRAARRRRS